jgi:SAM-dependent methyltransferase/uncharacterized protein YbaR (Trm112 family)
MMTAETDDATALATWLACPRCDSPLSRAGADPVGDAPAPWRCPDCAVDYPVVAGIPCLHSAPSYSLGEWTARFARERETARREVAQLDTVLAAPADGDIVPATRRRLALLRDARERWLEELGSLLAPFVDAVGRQSAPAGGAPEQDAASPRAASPGADERALATLIALRTRLPPAQAVMSYEANIFRDWAWGEEENRLCCDILRPLVPANSDAVLVLGCGAGRLAYDLHQACAPVCTVGLDLNPLLARVGTLTSAGDVVPLHEFPLAPRSLEDAAVARLLRAPAPARDGLSFVLGDVRRPPFRAGVADVVVTPWLVDVLEEDFAVFSARVNRLLRPGGRWLCFGSMNFATVDRRASYSVEEVGELLPAAGFTSPVVETHRLPYLQSPSSRHARVEDVVLLCSSKAREVPAPPRHDALPDWITRGDTPVPATESFALQAASTRIHAFLMSMVDGRRSLHDMAALMESQRLMPRAEAEQAIRGFLIKMYDEGRAGA